MTISYNIVQTWDIYGLWSILWDLRMMIILAYVGESRVKGSSKWTFELMLGNLNILNHTCDSPQGQAVEDVVHLLR